MKKKKNYDKLEVVDSVGKDYHSLKQELFIFLKNYLRKQKKVKLAELEYLALVNFGFGSLTVKRMLLLLEDLGFVKIDYYNRFVEWIVSD